MKSTNNRR